MPLRLKSLELQGYKTFASKTLFEFSENITAIVGPNGSGKSNIADSIRWVLGEQSYSLLRGKKTEDMIFTGSEFRPRAGMASATITFDNSDGWLPIDFLEVAVTRRAFRDGQNEYLINNQRVRLKDVSELFAQSGLSERTYTIIGQGLVDTALALRADERRRLFEEAAGIGLHRSRREEALRRLETTRRNLDRVQDILAELLPRLNSLEKQARRAQEYEQLRVDLQVLLRDWYGYHWHEAQREVSEARDLLKVQESSLERVRKNLIEIEVQLNAVRDQLQSLRVHLNTWHKDLAEKHHQLESIFKSLAVSDERERSIQNQQRNNQEELMLLNEEIASIQDRIDAAEKEVEQLESDILTSSEQKEKVIQSLNQRQSERGRVNHILQEVQKNLSGISNTLSQLEIRKIERQSQIERVRHSVETISQAIDHARKEQENAEIRLTLERNVLKVKQESQKQIEAVILEHREKTANLLLEIRQAQEGKTENSSRLAQAQAQLNVVVQAENSLSGYAAGTKIILETARQNRIMNIQGALNQFLEVPETYEIAISSALGEYIDGIIVLDEGNDALDILITRSARGVLLPVNSFKSLNFENNFPSNKEWIGIASSFVTGTAEMRPVFDLLLGQTMVVENRKAARDFLEWIQKELNRVDQPGCNWKAVTLQGEVFSCQGPIIAGSMGGNGQTIIGRTRQRREMETLVESTLKEVEKFSVHLNELNERNNVLVQENERLAQTQRIVRQETDRASLSVNQAVQSVETFTKQLAWHQEQLNRQQQELKAADENLVQIAKNATELKQKSTEIQEEIRILNRQLNALNLDEDHAQLADWNTRIAVYKKALDEAMKRLDERRSSYQKYSLNQSNLETRSKEMESLFETLIKERDQLTEGEKEVTTQITSMEKVIHEIEQEVQVAEIQQINIEKSDATARQALSVAEQHTSQTRIGYSRRQEAVDSLRRRIEDDFGLVLFEYSDDVSGPTPLPLGDMVEQLPRIIQLGPEIEENIKRQRAQLKRLGPINPEAVAEYHEVKLRYEFLTEQVSDLESAEIGVRKIIHELDTLMQQEFKKTFKAVAYEFKEIFSRLFGGGSARLLLTDPDNLTDTGVDIEARLPGRRAQGLSLLSGGERSLTATSLVFALLKVSPTPFCLLDEVDAMLDEENVNRFRDLLKELSENTQFIIVTHNRNTVQVSDVIYGITIGRDQTSQILSLKLDEVRKVIEEL